jgi:hypothetical protein
MTVMAAGRSGAEEDQGAVCPTICAAGVPAEKMACRADPGTSVLEGSDVLANWAMDIGSMVGRGSGVKAGETEDVLGAIAGGGGGSSAIASTRGGWQQRSPKPLPSPLPASRASLARDTMARLSLSSLLSLLIGVSKLKLTSLNFLVLMLP